MYRHLDSITRLALLFANVLMSFSAFGLSYMVYTPIQVTERTDVSVHGRVVSWSGPITHKNRYGDTFHDITLQLEILAATDNTPLGVVVLRSETSFHPCNPSWEID